MSSRSCAESLHWPGRETFTVHVPRYPEINTLELDLLVGMHEFLLLFYLHVLHRRIQLHWRGLATGVHGEYLLLVLHVVG